MKTKIFFPILFFSLIMFSCEKNTTDDEPHQINQYNGSGSYGDFLKIKLDQTANTYKIDNVTTGKADSGTLALAAADLPGIYKIEKNSKVYYFLENTKKFFAGVFPSGSDDNGIVFATSTGHDYLSRATMVAGDYTLLKISPESVNGSQNIKKWGAMSLSLSGSVRGRLFATAQGTGTCQVMLPENFNYTFPLTAGSISGSWKVNVSNPEKLDVSVTEDGKTYEAYVYADVSDAIFVMDMGEGKGFLIGIKNYATITQSQSAGNFRYVGILKDAAGVHRTGGSAKLNNTSGTMSFFDDQGTLVSNNIDNVSQIGVLKNTFTGKLHKQMNGVTSTEKIYIISMGEVYMAILFDESTPNLTFSGYMFGYKVF